MSLDKNLFTLIFKPRDDDSSSVDLVDPAGALHYEKRVAAGPVYRTEVTDPLTRSLLASSTSPAPLTKVKTIELYNPNSAIELKYTGLITFKWTFLWGEHEFEWKREACYLIRKPDPAVMVAVTREPSGKIQTTSVQILDYNLNRFDIDDRKGLELVILTSLLTFQDYNRAAKAPKGSLPATPPRSNSADDVPVLAPAPQLSTALAVPSPSSATPASKETVPATPHVREQSSDPAPAYTPPVPSRTQRSRSPADVPDAHVVARSHSPARTTSRLPVPSLPPRVESSPGPRRSRSRQPPVDDSPISAIGRVAAAERERAHFSVVRVEDDMNAKSYSQFCANLLKDETLLYITIRSGGTKHIDKTMKVVEKTNKLCRKSGNDKDLHQYVSWDFPHAEDNAGDKKKTKKNKKGTPPTGVSVHLSKGSMPELEPKLSTPSSGELPSPSLPLIPTRPSPQGKYASEPPPVRWDGKAEERAAKDKTSQSKKDAKTKKASSPQVQISPPALEDTCASARGRQQAQPGSSRPRQITSHASSPALRNSPQPSSRQPQTSSHSPLTVPPALPPRQSFSVAHHQRSVSAAPSSTSALEQAPQPVGQSVVEPISNPFLRPASSQDNVPNRNTWFGSFFGRSAVRAG